MEHILQMNTSWLLDATMMVVLAVQPNLMPESHWLLSLLLILNATVSNNLLISILKPTLHIKSSSEE